MCIQEWNNFVSTVYFLTYWHLLVQTIYIYLMQCTHDKLTSLSGNRKFVPILHWVGSTYLLAQPISGIYWFKNMISKTSDGFLFSKRIWKYLKLLCKTQSNVPTKLEFIYILQKFAWFILTCYLCMTFMLQLWCKILVAGFCGVLWSRTSQAKGSLKPAFKWK